MKKLIAVLVLASFLATPASAYYENYVDAALADGVIFGDENGNVNPDNPLTRAEFAVILTQFLGISGGINTFPDVSPHDWFADAMVAANYYSILVGDENGNARPYDMIRREDAVTVLGRYYAAKSQNTAFSEGVSDYAKPYWAYAVSNNLLTVFDPGDYISKGEVLALLYDYDTKDGREVRFLPGYPKISGTHNTLNHISVEIRTNKPCKIYYSLSEKGMPHSGTDTFLCETGNGVTVAYVKGNILKTYDLNLLAVTSDGATSKVSTLKGVRPFAIASGSGTKSSPYLIYTEEQLAQISQIPNSCFKLASDIVLTKNWAPIPDFYGTLDGNGYTVRGLSVYSKSHAGLFARSGGTIKNLTVCGNINSGKIAGVICGKNEGVIENCTAYGSVTVNTDYGGGICGQNLGTIKNCLASLGAVSSGSFSGGICGQNSGSLENCLAASNTVLSDMYAGAVSGVNDGGTISACVSACMTVHDVFTQNSGRITTNKNGGILNNNYFYIEATSDTLLETPSDGSQNGYDVDWNGLRDLNFYKSIGWDTKNWALAKNGFRLVYPKSARPPELTPGETIYFPKAIKTSQDLRNIDNNDSGHYILAEDIYLFEPWKTICTLNGFSGTLDGDGHTIHNLNLNTQTGIFTNITGGSVKNLNIKNATSSMSETGGILAACNYGYIDNCNVYAKIQTKKAEHVGCLVGLNHGAITNCRVFSDITSTNPNSTLGGICAQSDGVIFGCTYSGSISATSENTVVGGICGFETGGYVSDSFAYMTASVKTDFGYLGGICGMAEGSQLYKCASGGNIISTSDGMIYSGGICALGQNATLFNCYSLSDIHSFAQSGYIGGICGCNSGSIVQNTYSAGNILSGKSIYAGGICGLSENGFVMQNVSLNPAINGGENIGAICGSSDTDNVYETARVQKRL